ncbi:MAG: hypothetical protein PHE55_05120 [Methylococcaceae bacterium]|nr:hypothetical protein [Methylococcaceae bacterium]
MADKPATRLRNLRIDRVDLVDSGAAFDKATGEGAFVLLCKRTDELDKAEDISKPYPNEHAARMTDPGKYDRVRRQNDKLGPGVAAIFGIKSGGGTELQAVRFDSTKFTAAEAQAWLKDHKLKPTKFEPAAEKTSKQAARAIQWALAGTWEELQEKILEAAETKFASGKDAYVNLLATFDDSVVVCVNKPDSAKTYQLSWSRLDGEITLGEPQEVEVRRELKEIQKFRAAAMRTAKTRRNRNMDKDTVIKRLKEIEGMEDVIAFIEETVAKAAPQEPAPEDVLKTLPPEIRERIEKAEASAAEATALAKRLQDEKELDGMTAVCKAWTSISVDLATLPKHLVTIKRADPAAYDAFVKQMDAANSASKLTKEIGRAGDGGDTDGTVVGEVEKLANEIVAKNAKVTKQEAIDQVFRAHPDLYDRYRAESIVRA